MKPTEAKKPVMVIKVTQRPSSREVEPCTGFLF